MSFPDKGIQVSVEQNARSELRLNTMSEDSVVLVSCIVLLFLLYLLLRFILRFRKQIMLLCKYILVLCGLVIAGAGIVYGGYIGISKVSAEVSAYRHRLPNSVEKWSEKQIKKHPEAFLGCCSKRVNNKLSELNNRELQRKQVREVNRQKIELYEAMNKEVGRNVESAERALASPYIEYPMTIGEKDTYECRTRTDLERALKNYKAEKKRNSDSCKELENQNESIEKDLDEIVEQQNLCKTLLQDILLESKQVQLNGIKDEMAKIESLKKRILDL